MYGHCIFNSPENDILVFENKINLHTWRKDCSPLLFIVLAGVKSIIFPN